MKNLVPPFIIFLVAAAGIGLSQSTANDQLNDCSKKVVPYQDRNKIQTPVFSLDLTAAKGGRLLYIGSRHSLDPNDAEFSEFEKAWNDFKPTVAFYEGGASSAATSREESIKKSGEPGLVRFLAARDQVTAISLEPSRQDEVNYLLTKFSGEQIKLFYVLRVIAEQRDRNKRSESELRSDVVGILDRFTKYKGLESTIRNVAELETAYSHYWKTPQNWWEAPSKWFDPLKSSADTGGVFTNEVNQGSSSYRDLHMYTLLAKATLEGKRVFAIVGRDHLPMQEPALRCALK